MSSKRLDKATKLYPTHFGVWFRKFYTSMLGARPQPALAFAADNAERPTGLTRSKLMRPSGLPKPFSPAHRSKSTPSRGNGWNTPLQDYWRTSGHVPDYVAGSAS
jgi:hypothetical protein